MILLAFKDVSKIKRLSCFTSNMCLYYRPCSKWFQCLWFCNSDMFFLFLVQWSPSLNMQKLSQTPETWVNWMAVVRCIQRLLVSARPSYRLSPSIGERLLPSVSAFPSCEQTRLSLWKVALKGSSPKKKTGKCGNFEKTGGGGGLPKSHFFCNLTVPNFEF